MSKLCSEEYRFPGNCQTDEIMAILWKPELWEMYKAFPSSGFYTDEFSDYSDCKAVGFQDCHGAGEREMGR